MDKKVVGGAKRGDMREVEEGREREGWGYQERVSC